MIGPWYLRIWICKIRGEVEDHRRFMRDNVPDYARRVAQDMYAEDKAKRTYNPPAEYKASSGFDQHLEDMRTGKNLLAGYKRPY